MIATFRPELDWQWLLESVPDRYLVVDPALMIVAVTTAYLDATRTQREGIVGRSLFDVFPDAPGDAGASGVANLRSSLECVLATGRPHSMAVQRYPIRRPDGSIEERHWRPLNTPVLGEAGEVRWIVHRIEDVTDLVLDGIARDRALYEASVSTERLTQLLDLSGDALVVVDEQGIIVRTNAQTDELFGYEHGELIGQLLDVLIPERFRGAHDGHAGRYLAVPRTRKMGATSLELVGRRKNGSEVPIDVALTPLREGGRTMVSATIADVTARKQLEAAARLTADRLKNAVESMDDAFALFDAADRLILCNAVYESLVRPTGGPSLVGTSYLEILEVFLPSIHFSDDEARDRFRDERVARRGSEPTSFYDVRLRDGRSLRVVNRRTAEGGIVETIWDRTEDERRAAELDYARATAEAASAAKSDFLSSMSHELRTPLNAILGFAQLLQRDKRDVLSTRNRDRVGHIVSGGEHLLRLIDDVLDLSRIESGTMAVSLEPVGIEQVIRAVVASLQPLATRQQITIHLEPLPGGLPSVIADRTRLSQVLLNLCSNAIKYNRPGGEVRLTVATTEATSVRVSVSDTGLGIAPAKQGLLFQPFQRAGQETGPIEGTGIGLVITKRLTQLMGGRVGFASEAGAGSTFWVELRALEAATDATAAPRSRAPGALVRPGESRRILYVEDNPVNVAFMRDLLGAVEGIELLVAPTAERGREMALARSPNLVIMDVNLPGMSGIDAVRQLKAAEATRGIPVIALSAAASDRDRQRGLEAGFHRYLAKPVDVEDLLTIVEVLLTGPPGG